MSTARFSVQAAIVATMVVLVSFPEQREVRGAAVWRFDGPLATSRSARDLDSRPGSGRVEQPSEIGYGAALASAIDPGSLQRKLDGYDVEGRRRTFTTPAGVLLRGGKINAIIGLARTSMNAPISNARLLLRSIVTGKVEARAMADADGQFTFVDLIPSGYVVELVGPDGSIVAASGLVLIDVGELRETAVHAPGTGVHAAVGPMTSTVGEPLAAAANEGLNRVAQPDRSISPQR